MRRPTASAAFAVTAAMVLGTLLVWAVPGDGPDTAPGAPPLRPADDATNVAVLRPAGGLGSPELLEALRAARASPDDPETARTAARLLIADGRAAGDSRLVGAALGILRPVMEPPEPETLYLAATARQYQHDFEGALALLDDALALDPSHVNARLTRATIMTVQGRIREASEDCARLAVLRQDVGFLCQSTALILTPQAPAVAERLAAIVARPGLLDPALEPWAIGLLGEIAMARGNEEEGRRWLEDAIARDPGALRERLLLADLLLRTGQPQEIAALLADAPVTDGVLVRRARAARALGAPDVAAEDALAAMVQANLDLGLDAHAREDGMWALWIAGDAELALERAQANWDLQHEVEDVRLLVEAAVAAGRPEAARPVADWMAAEGIEIPAVTIPAEARP